MSLAGKTLLAVKAAEKILDIITMTPPESIQEALDKISTAGATYGILWGLENIQDSGQDLDFYELKGKVLEFMQKIQEDKNYPLATIVMAHVRHRGELEEIKR